MPDIILRHRGEGAFTLRAGDTLALAIDPCDADEKLDYVLLSRRRADRWEAVMDLMEASDATLVGPRSVCGAARRELELGEDEAVEMDGWDRVRSGVVRITAIPATSGSDLPGLGAIGGGALPSPSEVLSFNPFNALLNALSGGDLLPGAETTAWHLELADGLSVLWLGDALAGGVDKDWLLDVSELGDPDVLLAEAVGENVSGLVRAVRELLPDTVLLYRGHDPYAEGAPDSLPISRFVEALEEDSPQVEVVALRAGDAYVIGAPAPEAADLP